MSDHVVVIGSGASGVSFACCALEQGFRVTMVDVGLPRPEVPVPQSNFSELNRDLDDSRSYFLGEDFQSLILPGEENEYYGFPPAKDYVFEGVEGFEHESRGFSPLFSFAAASLR